MTRILPYGTWPSPLAPERLAQQRRIGAPLYGPGRSGAAGALWWTEVRPEDQGRGVLVRDGVDVVGAPYSVRTRVHEYGGRAYGFAGDRVVFSNDADGCLYVVQGGPPVRLTEPGRGWRFAEPVADLGRDRLIAVTEVHDAARREPENLLAAVSLADGTVTPLVTGRDFVAAPTLSPDGRTLAWLAWDHPHLPWDAAELWVAELDAAGAPHGARRIGGGAGGSALEPLFTPDGALWCAVEAAREGADAAWALHRRDGDRLVPAGRIDGELGGPLWQLGRRSLAAVDGGLVGLVTRQGRTALVRLDPAGDATVLDDAHGTLGDVASDGTRVTVAVGWTGSGVQLVERGPTGSRVVVDVLAGWLDPEDRAEPELVSFATGDGERAHAAFYAPRRAGIVGPQGALPPLVVLAHGGPTGCLTLAANLTVQFFTTRGFAVLDVNYRGSTGYGRAYRERLREAWGLVDVEDCVAGARWAAEAGRVDGARMVIRGGSAGGYTVLQALANHDVFAAGACHYGVSDLEAMVTSTHKFESRYDRFLVGPYPEARDRFVARSPIHYPERITVPVVFFQGLEDKAVPPEQTGRMAEALRARGIDAPFHGYAGEQHGYRKAETVRHAHETELAFYRRVLRLDG